MSIWTDGERDLSDAAKLVNEDAEVVTRYGPQPKKSFLRLQNEIETAAAAQREDIYENATPYTIGSFDTGFTYTALNQRGQFGNDFYVFLGGLGGLPHEVDELTDPTLSPSLYAKANYNDAASVANANGGSVQDYINRISGVSVEQLKDLPVSVGNIGETVKVKEYHSGSGYGRGTWIISTGLTANDIDIVQSTTNASIQYELDKSSTYTVDQMGAYRYNQDETPVLNSKAVFDRAIDIAIANKGGKVRYIGVYLYESDEYKEISDIVVFEGLISQISRIWMKGTGGTYRAGVNNHYFWHSAQRSLILRNTQFLQKDSNYVKIFYSCKSNDDFGQSGRLDDVIFSHSTDCPLHVVRGFGWHLNDVSVFGDYNHDHTTPLDVSGEVDNAALRFWGADGTLEPQSHSFSDNVVFNNVKLRGHKYLLDAYGLIAEIKSSAFEKGWLGIKSVKVSGSTAITESNTNKAGGGKCSIHVGQGSYFEQCTSYYATDREVSEVNGSELNPAEVGADIRFDGTEPRTGGPVEDLGFVGLTPNNDALTAKRRGWRLYLGDLGGSAIPTNWTFINIFANNPNKTVLLCNIDLFRMGMSLRVDGSGNFRSSDGSTTYLDIEESGAGASLNSPSNIDLNIGGSSDGWTIRGSGEFRPTTDGVYSFGSASNQIDNIYLVNNPIVSSDERLKTELLELSEKEELVAQELRTLRRKYKMLDSVEKKGFDKARWHFGMSAQKVKEAFERQGLDGFDYGVLCFDSWDDEYEEKIVQRKELDDQNKIVKPEVKETVLVREAGEKYGINYTELLMFLL